MLAIGGSYGIQRRSAVFQFHSAYFCPLPAHARPVAWASRQEYIRRAESREFWYRCPVCRKSMEDMREYFSQMVSGLVGVMRRRGHADERTDSDALLSIRLERVTESSLLCSSESLVRRYAELSQ